MASLRLVQLINAQGRRSVALVEEPNLRIVTGFDSVYALAMSAIRAGKSIADILETGIETLGYDEVYAGQLPWKLLSPFDVPDDPRRCLITGTGLTHKASVETRQSMHAAGDVANQPMTDSEKMYQIGLEGGRPARGKVGASPEWFYKGDGQILRAPNDPLDVPNHGEDGGDEAELAGCYVIADDGSPHRVGLVQGNEFSDHVMESRNYLYLAQSKLRHCSLGPEIVIGKDLSGEIRGHATIERAGKTIWAAPLASGEEHMCHSLANMEHHHFKHAFHRRAGDAHVYFFGADRFSFKDKIKLEEGDIMQVAFADMGRPLRNSIHIDRGGPELVKVRSL